MLFRLAHEFQVSGSSRSWDAALPREHSSHHWCAKCTNAAAQNKVKAAKKALHLRIYSCCWPPSFLGGISWSNPRLVVSCTCPWCYGAAAAQILRAPGCKAPTGPCVAFEQQTVLVLPGNRGWDGVKLGKDSGALLSNEAAATLRSRCLASLLTAAHDW